MSVTSAKAGLKARMQTLVTSGDVKVVLNGKPNTLHNLPLIYLESTDGERMQRGQLTVNRYRMTATTCVPYHDNVLSEDTVDALINKVAAAVDDAPTLNGAVNFATGTSWRADFETMGDITARTIVWTFEIVDKGPYQGEL